MTRRTHDARPRNGAREPGWLPRAGIAAVALLFVPLTALDHHRARAGLERLVTARAEDEAGRLSDAIASATAARRGQLTRLGRDPAIRAVLAAADSFGGVTPADLADRPELINLWLFLSVQFSGVEVFDSTGTPVLRLGSLPGAASGGARAVDLVPIEADPGGPRAVVRARPRPDRLVAAADPGNLGRRGYAAVIDRAGGAVVAETGLPPVGAPDDPRGLFRTLPLSAATAPPTLVLGSGQDRQAGAFVHLSDPAWSVFASGYLSEHGSVVDRMWLPEVLAVALALGLITGAVSRYHRGRLDQLRQRVEAEGARRALVGRVLASLAPGLLEPAGEEPRRLDAEVSHELRNPLASLRLSLEQLARAGAAGPRSGSTRRPVQTALREVQRLETTLKQALTLSGPAPSPDARAALKATAAEVAETLRPSADAAGIRIELPGPGPDLWVPLPPAALAGVLMNLVLNALEATPSGGTIRISARTGGDNASLALMTVEDEGPGVAPEVAKEIFRGGFTTRADGSGLGLSVAREVVESAGGRLDLADGSELSGACFIVELPRKRMDEEKG